MKREGENHTRDLNRRPLSSVKRIQQIFKSFLKTMIYMSYRHLKTLQPHTATEQSHNRGIFKRIFVSLCEVFLVPVHPGQVMGK